MINNVVIQGRLTKDVELKRAGETVLTNFTVACNRIKKDETDFINCTAFGKVAEVMEKYTKKGSLVVVQGRIQVEVVEKDGKKQTYVKVVANQVDFSGNAKQENNVEINDEEDLPF